MIELWYGEKTMIDRQTELLCQYCASVCRRMIKMNILRGTLPINNENAAGGFAYNIVYRYNGTQYCTTETVLLIFRFIQINITSQMWPSGGYGAARSSLSLDVTDADTGLLAHRHHDLSSPRAKRLQFCQTWYHVVENQCHKSTNKHACHSEHVQCLVHHQNSYTQHCTRA